VSRYKVLVDDNFHYMDEEERYEHGVFATEEEAVAACKRIVDVDLESWAKPGTTEQELYEMYMMFGEDPYIVPLDGARTSAGFSAWDYARQRCHVLAVGAGPAG
jgi:hypothetical protein